MLSEQALQEFREIWKEEFGEELEDKAATEEAFSLLALLNVVFRPVKKEWANEYDNETNQRNPE